MIRHKIYQILIIIFAFTLSACEETFVEAWGVENPSGEVDPPQGEPNSVILGEVITNVATNITETSVKLSGEIVSRGNSNKVEVGFLLYTGSETNFEINTYGVTSYGQIVSGNSFSKSITSLTASTKYKFRAYIKNEAGISYGQVKNFTTETGITQGEVITKDATEITFTEVKLNGDLVSTGNSTNYTIGFILYQGNLTNFTLTTSGVQNFEVPNSKSLFSKLLTNLNASTTYKFRAYITNEEGTSYGSVKTFTTDAAISLGQVTTNDATDITTTTATLKGILNSTGNLTNYTVGFLLYTGSVTNFTLTTSGVENLTTTASGTSLSKSLTDLNDNTTYKFRAYITNEVGTSYGDIKTFTTEEEIPNVNYTCLQTLTGHSDDVVSVSYSPDGTKIVSGSLDNTIKMWNANTGVCLQTLSQHSGDVYSVSYSPDGTKIASASSDRTIKIWNANTVVCLQTLTEHSDGVASVSYSSDGAKIVSGSYDETIKIWNANTGSCIRTLTGHSGYVYSVAYSPDGTKIVSGSYDNTIKIWNANTGACLQTLTGDSGGWLLSVSFSPDGTKVVSGSWNNVIKIWNANTGACLQTLTGHSGSVYSVAYSPDGTKIVSGSYDNTIKIWDANTGACLQTLTGHSGGVKSVAFSLDGTRIVSGSGNNTIKIWGEN